MVWESTRTVSGLTHPTTLELYGRVTRMVFLQGRICTGTTPFTSITEGMRGLMVVSPSSSLILLPAPFCLKHS
jgi:hypothetical protein